MYVPFKFEPEENKKSYCYNCDTDVDFGIKEFIIKAEINGVVFSHLAIIAYCNECGEEIYISELSDENVKVANKEYKAKLGLN